MKDINDAKAIFNEAIAALLEKPVIDKLVNHYLARIEQAAKNLEPSITVTTEVIHPLQLGAVVGRLEALGFTCRESQSIDGFPKFFVSGWDK